MKNILTRNIWTIVFIVTAAADVMAVCFDIHDGAELATAVNVLRLLSLFILGAAAICELRAGHRRRREAQNL